ncbi:MULTISPECIES: AraC family transcriptional regulator [unclassified Rhizobium]|uniref:AraC family transcriptional regulator n=1 Tax=unclassified Rhizobium TaxID=2613769 RepID=UPI001609C655|nr:MULTISPECIES: AraC family transcriptional regulator [unclassified Rhizobium]MBB3386221.1 AraC-like DNA-binding protein [Rhizobium sp. BK098]MBB3571908.1 AraC-like DNA-binding protein [Rhizobium sp. BK491]MBB3617925.1 AraC-like DNA-binding protein [Rhizobium sp. BK609]MBB3683622.1 AraC-like DNA-binding protein [Rhizobium sp. BK612]
MGTTENLLVVESMPKLRMINDPLSSVLALMGTRIICAAVFKAGTDWAMRFPPPDKIKFFVVTRGECLAKIDGIDHQYHVREGDVFLISKQSSFTLAAQELAPVQNGIDMLSTSEVLVDFGGDDLMFFAGHVDLDSISGIALLEQLPPAIHVSADSSQARTLSFLIEQLVEEYLTCMPGAAHGSNAIAQLIFLQLLRSRISDLHDTPIGWLRALGDPNLATALTVMHADPGHAWTLTELAKVAGLSRTGFAVRFKLAAGIPPLTYLKEWRMRLAERGLRDGTPLSKLAETAGYASEAAFSSAFKRVFGLAPTHYLSRLPIADYTK